MHSSIVPRVRIYLRMQRTQAEDFEDILTQGHLSFSDLELEARKAMDTVGQLRYLDERAQTKARE